jgi:hypothetical protein
MSNIFDPTSFSEEIREALSKFMKSHKKELINFLTTDQIQMLMKASEETWIDEELKLHFPDEKTLKLLRSMEYGSRVMPKFEILTLLNEIVKVAEAAISLDEVAGFWEALGDAL